MGLVLGTTLSRFVNYENGHRGEFPNFKPVVVEIPELIKWRAETDPDGRMQKTKPSFSGNQKRSRMVGLLGELLFEKYFPTAVYAYRRGWDYDWKNQKIEIKTNAITHEKKNGEEYCMPRTWQFVFAEELEVLNCDYIIRIAILPCFTKAIFVGACHLQIFHKYKMKIAEGKVWDGMPAKRDSYAVRAEHFEGIQKWREKFK